jgi:AraC family transcriptional regulator
MDHLKQIQRAVDYIEENLRDELPFWDIAKRAGYSMWHFQRVFGATVGDTVKEYIRKRRLASALHDLAATEKRILDIALEYQFESQESFSRAFKGEFGRTPGECRKKRHLRAPDSNKATNNF